MLLCSRLLPVSQPLTGGQLCSCPHQSTMLEARWGAPWGKDGHDRLVCKDTQAFLEAVNLA